MKVSEIGNGHDYQSDLFNIRLNHLLSDTLSMKIYNVVMDVHNDVANSQNFNKQVAIKYLTHIYYMMLSNE